MDLFDMLQGMLGRPDPRAQLAAAMGQAPGQPGGPPAPMPGAGAAGAPPAAGGPPGGPAGGGGPPPSQGGPPAQPQPAAYQSPPDLAQAYQALSGGGQASGQDSGQANTQQPDLAQMYMALHQRDQAKQGFWGGLAGMAAALHPGRVTPAMMKAIQGPQEDPDSMFNNLLQIQHYEQQNQALQAYRQGLPAMFNQLGIDKSLMPLAMSDPSFITKIAEAKAGVGGGPAWMAQQRAEQALTAQGKPIPWTPGDPSSYDAYTKAQTGEAVTTAKTKADDLVADQHNFAPALANYDKGIGLIDQFNTPDMQEGAKEFLGTGGSMRPVATMSANGKAAWALYKQIMATQYSAGVQDFKGAGRITQTELTQDAPSQSTMGQLNQDPNDFFAGVQKYRDQLAQHRATLFGAAQKGDDPRLSDEDYTKYVAPNSDLFGGPKRNIPDFRKMNDADADAAFEKLSPGQLYIGPDGQPRKK